MQITGYSLEVNGLKQERTTHRCLRSFNCNTMILTFQCPFELSRELCPVLQRAYKTDIKFDKVDRQR